MENESNQTSQKLMSDTSIINGYSFSKINRSNSFMPEHHSSLLIKDSDSDRKSHHSQNDEADLRKDLSSTSPDLVDLNPDSELL